MISEGSESFQLFRKVLQIQVGEKISKFVLKIRITKRFLKLHVERHFEVSVDGVKSF